MQKHDWHKPLTALAGLLPVTLAFGLLAPLLLSPAPKAQEAGKPAVRMSSVIMAEPEVATSLGIEINGAGQVPGQTYLRIKGLPLSAKLSDGHVVTPGVWAVPLTALASLRLTAPLAGSGRTELNVALMTVDGGVLAEARSSLVVAPAWLLGTQTQRGDPPRQPPVITPAADPAPPALPPAASALVARTQPAPAPPSPPPARAASPAPRPQAPPPPVVAAVTPPPAPARAPVRVEPPAAIAPPAVRAAPAPPAVKAPAAISAEDRKRAEVLVQRGETFLSQGNAAAARQFFRRAADLGLAQAALRLGHTYDPAELPSLRATGLDADPGEARRWYERARDLGATEAVARLTRLQGK